MTRCSGAPSPRISACFPWPSGTTKRSFSSRASGRAGVLVSTGFERAREHSRSVIVETFLEGDDHRLLVVNGELIEIDFAARRIRLRLLRVRRDIVCSYEDSVEPTLLEHPRELIQVFGSVSVDARGVPRTIEAVDFIRPIREVEDVSIDSFDVGNRTVRARRRLAVSIRFDREEQLFTATIPSLEIETVGETHDDVVEGIVAELRVLWRNYARADEARLTAGARNLKGRLLEAFEETLDAA